MPRRRLFWNIFLIFLLVIVLCVVAIGELALRSHHAFYLKSQTEDLAALARLARLELTPDAFSPAAAPAVQHQAEQLAAAAAVRVTLIRPDGRVIGDSEESPARMENHAGRPEIQAALRGRLEPALRYSNTLKTNMLYVAVPAADAAGRPVGVVRVAQSLRVLESKMSEMRRRLWQSAALGAALTALVSLYLSRLMSRPIEHLRRAAERYAQGDYSRRLFMPGPAEFTDLAKSMNRMAREMDRRLREITRQRNEREAILASMREGVLAVDRAERIIMINPSAEAILGVRAADSVGRLVQESLRHVELQRLLARALTHEPLAQPPAESPQDSLLHWPGGRLLQVERAPLRDENGAETGLLLVLSDVTRLHQLENLRREFVANVSHELRTPITSIKGFVETLRDGAVHEPENAGRFLEIIARQADRLNAIIEDLLALSRLEREAEGPGIELAPCPLAPLLAATLQHFTPQCEEKGIALALDCPPDLTARANAQLLEQAVGNLLDNAIKYSPAGAPIRLEAAHAETDREIQIRVIDRGPGIPAHHLPRLFERFYRVDSARSRELGGTGLGLAIVKHIVQAHGGRVSVQSQVGQGSTFTLHLPAEVPHG